MDWFAAGLSVVATYLLPKRKLIAVYIYLGSSVLYLVWACYAHIWSIAVLQLIMITLNIRTIILWKPPKQGS